MAGPRGAGGTSGPGPSGPRPKLAASGDNLAWLPIALQRTPRRWPPRPQRPLPHRWGRPWIDLGFPVLMLVNFFFSIYVCAECRVAIEQGPREKDEVQLRRRPSVVKSRFHQIQVYSSNLKSDSPRCDTSKGALVVAGVQFPPRKVLFWIFWP